MKAAITETADRFLIYPAGRTASRDFAVRTEKSNSGLLYPEDDSCYNNPAQCGLKEEKKHGNS